jgi:hypothetical protein
MEDNESPSFRRVILLDTDERAGLVAGIAASCSSQGISLDITTGPGHVLLTFVACDDHLTAVKQNLSAIAGVKAVYPYSVISK